MQSVKTPNQNMQTQKATSYLVENILLLYGRYMERVEEEREVIDFVAGVGAMGRF